MLLEIECRAHYTHKINVLDRVYCNVDRCGHCRAQLLSNDCLGHHLPCCQNSVYNYFIKRTKNEIGRSGIIITITQVSLI